MKHTTTPTPLRCAIYTRKSSEEGLEQEFNSLDAQREAAEAYIRSQLREGWKCLPERYDDGGFSGGTIDRPALTKLLSDIQAGRIDAVVVYKVDRLSRSLLDFARMMEIFDKHQVSFVAVTQQFNTATSMGRLVLNVLLSFAQFEREIISERTRDKIAATRRKGKWSGGMPLLGYNVDASAKLVVNQEEAERVRAIFALYLERRGLLPVVEELAQRDWRNKRWTTRKGQERGGSRFTKTTLHLLLTNVTYLGKVRYKNEVHAGEHAAIVAVEIWQQVQDMLKKNRCVQPGKRPSAFEPLFKGLLRCAACDCAMIGGQSVKRSKRYRYYTCLLAQKNGVRTCPAPCVPAEEIERFVLEEIRRSVADTASLARTARRSRSATRERVNELDAALIAAFAGSAWDGLTAAEQSRAVQLLIKGIDYAGGDSTVTIAFHPEHLPLLAKALQRPSVEVKP